MGTDLLDAATVAQRLAAQFEIEAADAVTIVEQRLTELAAIGLVERARA
jgi:hypothetical protein